MNPADPLDPDDVSPSQEDVLESEADERVDQDPEEVPNYTDVHPDDPQTEEQFEG